MLKCIGREAQSLPQAPSTNRGSVGSREHRAGWNPTHCTAGSAPAQQGTPARTRGDAELNLQKYGSLVLVALWTIEHIIMLA